MTRKVHSTIVEHADGSTQRVYHGSAIATSCVMDKAEGERWRQHSQTEAGDLLSLTNMA